jgi:hypothetical protein
MRFEELAEAIAHYLSTLEETWTADPYPHDRGRDLYYLHGPDGEEILLKSYEGGKRVRVTGNFPEYNHHNPLSFQFTYGDLNYPEITCAADRGARTIAKEIRRRFLVDYRSCLREARRLVRKYERQDQQIREATLAIAGALNLSEESIRWNRSHGNVTARPKLHFYAGDHVRADFDIYSDESIGIQLNGVPADLAQRIAEVVAQHE